jgi:hypothetical protein
MARKKKAPEAIYRITANILGQNYTAEGATFKEALLRLSPKNPKGRLILTGEKIENKDGEEKVVKREKIFNGGVCMRLFSAGIAKEVAVKNVSLMFGGL